MACSRSSPALLILAGLLSASLVAEGASAEQSADPGQRAEAAAARGDLREAAALWRQAADDAQEADDDAGRFRALLRLGESQRDLGQPRDAVETLSAAVSLADDELGPAQAAAARGALGSSLRAAGDAAAAQRALEQAETLARESGAASVAAAVTNELGSLHAARGERAAALEAYTRAAADADAASDAPLAFRARVNRVALANADADAASLPGWIAEARQHGEALPASHDAAFGWILLGRSSAAGGNEADLERGLAMARQLGDSGATSWALGSLSELRARQGRDPEARKLAEQALAEARRARLPDAELRWLAQLGRLEARSGQRDQAIAHLGQAAEILAERRLARLSAEPPGASPNPGPGVDVYLELVDLLLQRARERGDPQLAAADLLRAQRTVERFRAAELRDYFHDDCVDAYRQKVANPAAASPHAAVIYPISLPDRLELLVSSRAGMRQFTVPVARRALDEQVALYRRKIRDRGSLEFVEPAQKLYAWLVAPAREYLDGLGIDTLVFVPGGSLRTVPMAALHDGTGFLIEHYALATTPGLELTDPRPVDREHASVFLGGLSEPVQGFPALAHVPEELESVQEVFGGELLLDDAFTTRAVRADLQDHEFSVVHIATHAEFGDTPEDTYLLTDDGRLSMDELAESVGAFRYRDKPLDLIVLSACETAAGDERAALGLAGVAVKSGARSAVGTLWKVNDVATSLLVQEFYKQLRQPSVSRAEALRRAQLHLLADLRYRHPRYWSPFLLISNWL